MVDFWFRVCCADDTDNVEAHIVVDIMGLDIVIDGQLETLHLPVVDGFLRFAKYPVPACLDLYEYNGSGFIFNDDINVAMT